MDEPLQGHLVDFLLGCVDDYFAKGIVVHVKDAGWFFVVERESRIAVNPMNPAEKTLIPASNRLVFQPDDFASGPGHMSREDFLASLNRNGIRSVEADFSGAQALTTESFKAARRDAGFEGKIAALGPAELLFQYAHYPESQTGEMAIGLRKRGDPEFFDQAFN